MLIPISGPPQTNTAIRTTPSERESARLPGTLGILFAASLLVGAGCMAIAFGYAQGTLGSYARFYLGFAGLAVAAVAALATRALSSVKRTEQNLQDGEERFHRTFTDSAVGMAILDANGAIASANPVLCSTLGYTQSELQNKPCWTLAAAEHIAGTRAAVSALCAGEFETFVAERQFVRKDGEPVWLRTSASALRLNSKPAQAMALFEDVSAYKRVTQELAHRDFHDSLTGLPNRAQFELALTSATGQTRPGDPVVALLYLDIDDFKQVNDTSGHHAGDLLLRQVAERMKACLRRTDVLARVGGDEFTIILNGLPDANTANEVTESLLRVLSTPFEVENQEIYLTASVGVSIYPHDGKDTVALLRQADVAMHEAKLDGKAGYRRFSSEMESARWEKVRLERDLRHAIERDQLFLSFQPQYEMTSEKVVRFEALCRWMHPEKGLITPLVFIPIAEETGMIVPIGNWVLRAACEFAVECQARTGRPMPVAVNVSAAQFTRSDFAEIVRTTLAETGLDPALLELELTESLLMSNIDENVQKMSDLKASGVLLSIDDFGTGYSSLGYLQRMPIDRVKIDRSFLQSVERGGAAFSLIRSIVSMAHDMNLRVVVEGVETSAQLEQLSGTGCDEVQGYLLGRPESQDAALSRVESENHYTTFGENRSAFDCWLMKQEACIAESLRSEFDRRAAQWREVPQRMAS